MENNDKLPSPSEILGDNSKLPSPSEILGGEKKNGTTDSPAPAEQPISPLDLGGQKKPINAISEIARMSGDTNPPQNTNSQANAQLDSKSVDDILSKHKDLDWVQRLYEKNTPNIQVQGEPYPSTHLMSDDGNGYVFPRIQRINGKLVDLGDKAEDYARETKTGIQLPKDIGTAFAANGYKKGTNVLSDFQVDPATQQQSSSTEYKWSGDNTSLPAETPQTKLPADLTPKAKKVLDDYAEKAKSENWDENQAIYETNKIFGHPEIKKQVDDWSNTVVQKSDAVKGMDSDPSIQALTELYQSQQAAKKKGDTKAYDEITKQIEEARKVPFTHNVVVKEIADPDEFGKKTPIYNSREGLPENYTLGDVWDKNQKDLIEGKQAQKNLHEMLAPMAEAIKANQLKHGFTVDDKGVHVIAVDPTHPVDAVKQGVGAFIYGADRAMGDIETAFNSATMNNSQYATYLMKKSILDQYLYPTETKGIVAGGIEMLGQMTPMAPSMFVPGVGGAIFGGLTMASQAKGSSAQRYFNEGINEKGLSPIQAAEYSANPSNKEATIQGIAGTVLPGVSSLTEKALLNAGETGLTMKYLAHSRATSGIFAGAQATTNLLNGKPLTEGVPEAIGGAFAFSALTEGIKSGLKLTKPIRDIYDVAWGRGFNQLEPIVKQGIQDGTIPQGFGESLLANGAEMQKTVSQVPHDWTPAEIMVAKPFLDKIDAYKEDLKNATTETARADIEGKIKALDDNMSTAVGQHRAEVEGAKAEKAKNLIKDDELLSAYVDSNPELSKEREEIASMHDDELRDRRIEAFKEKATGEMPDKFVEDFTAEKKAKEAETIAKAEAKAEPVAESKENATDEAKEPVQEKGESLPNKDDIEARRKQEITDAENNPLLDETGKKEVIQNINAKHDAEIANADRANKVAEIEKQRAADLEAAKSIPSETEKKNVIAEINAKHDDAIDAVNTTPEQVKAADEQFHALPEVKQQEILDAYEQNPKAALGSDTTAPQSTVDESTAPPKSESDRPLGEGAADSQAGREDAGQSSEKPQAEQGRELKGLDKSADALHNILSKFGGIKELDGKNEVDVAHEFKRLGEGLIEAGKAKAETLIEDVKKYLGDKWDEKMLPHLEDAAKQISNSEEPAKEGEWTPIRKEEITDAKNNLAKRGITWTETVKNAMESLAKETPQGKSLYDTAVERVRVLQERIRGGEKVNPNSEEVAALTYARAKTRQQMADLYDGVTSSDPNIKALADIQYSALESNLSGIDEVLSATGSEAGRAFNIRQIEGKIDVNEEMKIRRMQIEKASGLTMTDSAIEKLEQLIDATKETNDKLDKLMGSDGDFETAVRKEAERLAKEQKPVTRKYTNKAKNIADKIRGLKTKPFTFTDSEGNVFEMKQNGIIPYDEIVEGVAKLVEKTGVLADSVKATLDKYADSDWYKNLSGADKEKLATDLTKHLEVKEDTAIDYIKEHADAEKSTNITKKMVADGLINDIVGEHVKKGVETKEVLKSVTEELKKELPDVTEQQVSDAYLKEGEYKLEKKEKVQSDIAKAKEEIKNITRLQKDIDALEVGKEVARKTASGDKKAESEYEKSLRDKKEALINEKKDAENAQAKSEKEALQKKKAELAEQQKRFDDKRKALDKEQAELDKQSAKIEKEKNAKYQKDIDNKRKEIDKAQSEIDKASAKAEKEKNAQHLKDKQKEIDRKRKELKEKEAENKRESIRIAKEINAKEAKLEEINQKIADVENEGKLWEKNKKANPDKVDADLKAAQKKLDDAIRKAGIKVDRNSGAVREAKEQVAKAHNDRIDNLTDDINTHLMSGDLSDSEKAALSDARDKLQASKIDTTSKQDIEQLHKNAKEKAQTMYEHLKEKGKQLNSEPIREAQKSLKELIKNFEADKEKNARDIQADRRKATLERGIKERERQIAAGEVEGKVKPTPPEKTAEIVKLEIEKRKLDSEFRRLAHKEKERNKTKIEKATDLVMESRVASLIFNFWGLTKIGLSAITKQPLEALTRSTAGKIAHFINPRLSEAAGGEANATFKQEQERLRATFSRMTPEKLAEKRVANADALDNATEKFNDAKAKLKEIEDESGKGKDYDNYKKGEYAKAEAAYRKANLDVAANVIYDWLGASSTEDATKIWMQGLSHIEEAMGDNIAYTKADAESMREKYLYVAHSMGRIHSIMKNFSARGEFAASFVGRLEQMQKRGVDISDPANQILAADAAYKEGYKRGKYMNDNAITTHMKGIVQGIERGDWDKLNKNPNLRYVVAKVLNFDAPIVKVPMNILNEAVTEYTLGAVVAPIMHIAENVKGFRLSRADGASMKEAFEGMQKHIAELPEDKADFILRCYRKGGFGLGLVALAGLSGAVSFGGFYRQGEPKKHPNDLGFGEISIDGKKLPKHLSKALAHLPVNMPTLLALNYERVKDLEQNQRREPKTESEATNKAFEATLDAIMDENPYRDMFHPLKQAQDFLPIPGIGLVKDVSEMFDTDSDGNLVQRKPESWVDRLKMKTGIDRQSVPEKPESVESKARSLMRQHMEDKPKLGKMSAENAYSKLPDDIKKEVDNSLTPEQKSKLLHDARYDDDFLKFQKMSVAQREKVLPTIPADKQIEYKRELKKAERAKKNHEGNLWDAE